MITIACIWLRSDNQNEKANTLVYIAGNSSNVRLFETPVSYRTSHQHQPA